MRTELDQLEASAQDSAQGARVRRVTAMENGAQAAEPGPEPEPEPEPEVQTSAPAHLSVEARLAEQERTIRVLRNQLRRAGMVPEA